MSGELTCDQDVSVSAVLVSDQRWYFPRDTQIQHLY